MMMRIKELREAKGLTQQNLAEEMNVLQNGVSNWEKEISLPRTRELPRLAKVLGCTITELFAPEAIISA